MTTTASKIPTTTYPTVDPRSCTRTIVTSRITFTLLYLFYRKTSNSISWYNTPMIIAVDTGGTKTLITRFDDAGVMSFISKFPTPRDKQEYLSQVAASIKETVEDSGIDAIVVAMPGPIKNGVVQRTPNIGWENFDVASSLRGEFPDTAIFIANDADLGGIGEARSLDDPKLCLYLTLSTGVGTGLTYQGKLLPGLRRFEGGSIRIDYGGERIRWEGVASGSGFYERYHQYGSEVDDPDKWRDYADRISSGLLAFIPLLEPDHIVIGGSMGAYFERYSGFLQEMLNSEIAKHMTDVQITQAKHPEEAVVYGCYYHALDQLNR